MTTAAEAEKTVRISELNDRFRKGDRTLGKYRMSQQVSALSLEEKGQLVQLIRAFDDFSQENDPYGEHDFGSIGMDGEMYYFKIDYYDSEFMYGAEDPSDERYSCRLLTIMHSSEY
jgi:hypothetical protein